MCPPARCPYAVVPFPMSDRFVSHSPNIDPQRPPLTTHTSPRARRCVGASLARWRSHRTGPPVNTGNHDGVGGELRVPVRSHCGGDPSILAFPPRIVLTSGPRFGLEMRRNRGGRGPRLGDEQVKPPGVILQYQGHRHCEPKSQ